MNVTFGPCNHIACCQDCAKHCDTCPLCFKSSRGPMELIMQQPIARSLHPLIATFLCFANCLQTWPGTRGLKGLGCKVKDGPTHPKPTLEGWLLTAVPYPQIGEVSLHIRLSFHTRRTAEAGACLLSVPLKKRPHFLGDAPLVPHHVQEFAQALKRDLV